MGKATKEQEQYTLVTQIGDIIPILTEYRQILNNKNSEVFSKFSNFIYWYYFPNLNIYVPNLFLAYKEMANKPYPEHPRDHFGMYGGPAWKALLKLNCFEKMDDGKKGLIEFANNFINYEEDNVEKTIIFKLKEEYFDKFNHITSMDGLKKSKQQLTSNVKHDILNKAFDSMQPILPNFIGRILQNSDKNDWWQNKVLKKLSPNSVKDLPKSGSYEEYIDSLDISLSLKIIIENWHDVFKQRIKDIKFSWVHELIEIRNDVSHWSNKKAKTYTFEHINHALDVMKLFMLSIDTDVSAQISEIIKEFEDKYKG